MCRSGKKSHFESYLLTSELVTACRAADVAATLRASPFPQNGVGEGEASCAGSVSPCNLFACLLQPFAGGGYRLGATPEEESAYVAGERRQSSVQDVSSSLFCFVDVTGGISLL